MSRRCRHCAAAFTMADMVAVVATVVIMVSTAAVLLCGCRSGGKPGESGASGGPAARALCSSNLKSVGQAMHGFAAAHKGRFPGRAKEANAAEILSWQVILNREWFHGNDPQFRTTSGPILRKWDQKTPPEEMKGVITCPSLRAWGDTSREVRPYAMNRDAAGGTWNEGYPGAFPMAGYYGVMVVPPPQRYAVYTLGAVGMNFPNPSFQFLVCESEGSADEITHLPGKAVDSNGTVVLGDSPAFPRWSGCDGTFAFRHGQGRSMEKLSNPPQGCFLFIDGHVESLTPDQRINSWDRFAYRQR